jgi:hypothetical protein
MPLTPSTVEKLLVLFSFVALLFNILAFALPNWGIFPSHEGEENIFTRRYEPKSVETGNFGLWGYCQDTSAQVGSISVPKCYHFFSKQTISAYNVDVSVDFCAPFTTEGQVIRSESRPLGMSQEVYQEKLALLSFLQSYCNAGGQTTLAFGALSMIFALFGFVAVVLAFTFYKTKAPQLIFATKWLSAAAALFGIVTFSSWIAQFQPLINASSASIGASFVLMILSIVLLGVVSVLIHKQQQRIRLESLQHTQQTPSSDDHHALYTKA